jgi:hypothetical protein
MVWAPIEYGYPKLNDGEMKKMVGGREVVYTRRYAPSPIVCRFDSGAAKWTELGVFQTTDIAIDVTMGDVYALTPKCEVRRLAVSNGGR